MQTKSPLALMEPRFAVTDQLRWQNSSWVHRARESCARSPIVRLQNMPSTLSQLVLCAYLNSNWYMNDFFYYFS
jgi:hypothetical protein